jgi:hypothetical protein
MHRRGRVLAGPSPRDARSNQGSERISGCLRTTGRAALLRPNPGHCNQNDTGLCHTARPLSECIGDGKIREAAVYLRHRTVTACPFMSGQFHCATGRKVIVGCSGDLRRRHSWCLRVNASITALSGIGALTKAPNCQPGADDLLPARAPRSRHRAGNPVWGTGHPARPAGGLSDRTWARSRRARLQVIVPAWNNTLRPTEFLRLASRSVSGDRASRMFSGIVQYRAKDAGQEPWLSRFVSGDRSRCSCDKLPWHAPFSAAAQEIRVVPQPSKPIELRFHYL